MLQIRDDGVYLLENGLHMLLFVGLAANPAWIQVLLHSLLKGLSHEMEGGIINRKVSLNPVASEAKKKYFIKGPVSQLERCTKNFHLKQHGSFQIAVFFQSA